jgi:hypothetical protein
MGRCNRPGDSPHEGEQPAFDCNPDTMREHDLVFDRAKVADGVFTQIQNGGAAGGAKNGNGGTVGAQEAQPKEKDSRQSTQVLSYQGAEDRT